MNNNSFRKNNGPNRENSRISEEELIDGLVSGCERAFEVLIKSHGGYLITVLRRFLHNDADVQDCVQETFLTAFEKISSFEKRSSLRSWLHRIAVNQALSKLRSRSRRPEQLLDDTSSLFDDSGARIVTENEKSNSAEVDVSNQQELEDIKGIIENLPEVSRNLLLLRDIEGYSTEETASILKLSSGAVKTGLHRARHALKTQLEN